MLQQFRNVSIDLNRDHASLVSALNEIVTSYPALLTQILSVITQQNLLAMMQDLFENYKKNSITILEETKTSILSHIRKFITILFQNYCDNSKK